VSVVYFIRAGDDGPVKIGLTFDVASRMSALQLANAAMLRVIHSVDGDKDTESIAHEDFRPFHIRGEWFRFDGSMIGWVPKGAAKEGGRRKAIHAEPKSHGYITQCIERLARWENAFVEDANRRSVTVLASKFGADTGRIYRTARENGGVRIWRLR
jgi:hypothetical protein